MFCGLSKRQVKSVATGEHIGFSSKHLADAVN